VPQPKQHDDGAAKLRAWRRTQKLQALGPLAALFPYWGGKAQVAPLIWQRLGKVRHYVEPFAGSLAVLLARPHPPKVETVNDADGLLINVWRSLAQDPRAVAQYAEAPVASIELWAKNDFLCRERGALTAKLTADHRYCDPELAGLWMYCVSTWLGSGVGVKAGGRGPVHVQHTGHGLHALSRRGQLPRLCTELQLRLQGIRLLCGDWRQCLDDRILRCAGAPVGIVFDPPYNHALRNAHLYAVEEDCAPAVRDWAVASGDNPQLRIALCGLKGEHVMPDTWSAVAWQSRGGLANTKYTGRGSGETRQEVVWFSPHCLQAAPAQGTLFPAAD
jgi:DNA adenine methylase